MGEAQKPAQYVMKILMNPEKRLHSVRVAIKSVDHVQKESRKTTAVKNAPFAELLSDIIYH